MVVHLSVRRMPEAALPEIAAPRRTTPRHDEDADVRHGLIDDVRRRLAAGEYDEERKLDAVLDRLAADLGVSLRDEAEE